MGFEKTVKKKSKITKKKVKSITPNAFRLQKEDIVLVVMLVMVSVVLLMVMSVTSTSTDVFMFSDTMSIS